MVCPKCGNEVHGNSKFCGKCGAMLDNSGSNSASEKKSGQMDAKQVLDFLWNQAKKVLSKYIDTWCRWKKMEDKEKYIWIGIHGVWVVLLCGIVIIGSVSRNEQPKISVIQYEESGSENQDNGASEDNELVEETPRVILEVEGGNCEAGKSCFFGSYPLSEEPGGVEIEWIILDVEEDRIHVLSKYLLPERQAFHDTGIVPNSVKWDKCSLKAWLNDSFYNDAFTEEQKNAIVTMKNGDYSFSLGGDDSYSLDKVYCLSSKEAEKYIKSLGKLVGTYYDYGELADNWWLRTNNDECTLYVSYEGECNQVGSSNVSHLGVRPAMTIDLNAVSVVSR